MKVRTKLFTTALISITMLSVLSASLFFFYFKLKKEHIKELMAESFKESAYSILILTHEYTALQSKRTERLLENKLKKINDVIQKSEGLIPLGIIRNAFKSLNNSYIHLKSIYNERKDLIKSNARQEEIDRTLYLEEAMTTLLFSESHKIMSIANRITKEAREEKSELQKMGLILVIIFSLLLVFIIGTSAIIVAVGITNSLKLLQESADIIGSGDLEKNVPDLGKDEFGSLAKAFDDMRKKRRQVEEEMKKSSIIINSMNKKLAEQYEKIRLSEQRLNYAHNFLNNVINSMPSVLIVVDPEYRVTHWNRETEILTGIKKSHALECKLDAVFPQMSEEMPKIQQAIKEQIPLKHSKVPYACDRGTCFSDVIIYPLTSNHVQGAVIRVDDVTDRVRMEEIMIQTEKMMSVGGLAAGMAHEINNPLAGILQNSQVVINRLSGDMKKNIETAESCGTDMDTIKEYMKRRGIIKMIQAIMESGKRAAKIVDNMLSFSRKSKSQFMYLDLGKLMDRTLEIASNDYDMKKKYDFRKINIIRSYEPGIPAIRCEETKIQQVFLNLLTNAAQALSEQKNGGIKKNPEIILSLIKKSGMARIEIEDNGPGMEENIRKRIFEPFFTTKNVGIGTGLGLSVSYFIVKENHKGTMTVESVPGKGTKFIIELPIAAPGAI